MVRISFHFHGGSHSKLEWCVILSKPRDSSMLVPRGSSYHGPDLTHRWLHLKRNHFPDVPRSSIFKISFFFSCFRLSPSWPLTSSGLHQGFECALLNIFCMYIHSDHVLPRCGCFTTWMAIYFFLLHSLRPGWHAEGNSDWLISLPCPPSMIFSGFLYLTRSSCHAERSSVTKLPWRLFLLWLWILSPTASYFVPQASG